MILLERTFRHVSKVIKIPIKSYITCNIIFIHYIICLSSEPYIPWKALCQQRNPTSTTSTNGSSGYTRRSPLIVQYQRTANLPSTNHPRHGTRTTPRSVNIFSKSFGMNDIYWMPYPAATARRSKSSIKATGMSPPAQTSMTPH